MGARSTICGPVQGTTGRCPIIFQATDSTEEQAAQFTEQGAVKRQSDNLCQTSTARPGQGNIHSGRTNGGIDQDHERDLFTRIKSIPGLGRKTAILLIVATNGFKDFESSKQVSSYFGLAPHERSSGSSVKGKAHIGKNGHPLVRNHLFLCSFTACMYNPQCKALFERIVAKGKSKKLALVAVSNKLIKQAFAIAKSGLYYDENYRSGLV